MHTSYRTSVIYVYTNMHACLMIRTPNCSLYSPGDKFNPHNNSGSRLLEFDRIIYLFHVLKQPAIYLEPIPIIDQSSPICVILKSIESKSEPWIWVKAEHLKAPIVTSSLFIHFDTPSYYTNTPLIKSCLK